MLHLSKHHGDGSHGSTIFVRSEGIKAYQQELAPRDQRSVPRKERSLPRAMGEESSATFEAPFFSFFGSHVARLFDLDDDLIAH
jgi:hypothetical protein